MAFNMIGPLLIGLGDTGRGELADRMAATIAAGVCPAVVCLIGRARSGEKGAYSFTSMVLPMAPYVDRVVAA
jgi:hypothetical protein